MAQAPLYVSLSDDEDQQLFELQDTLSAPKRTRRRAAMLRLSHRRWKTDEIAEYLGCRPAMVRGAIHRWQSKGISGLYDHHRSGRPRRWQDADLAYIDTQLAEDPRTFSSRQVVALLAQERHVHLSERHMRRLLKKRGTAGSGLEPAIEASKTPNSRASNKQT